MSEYKDLLAVDRTRMEEMLDTQPTRYMWAVEQAANAEEDVRAFVQKLEVVKAEVYSRLKGLTGPNGKPFSEAAVGTMMPAEPEYETAYAELTEAKKIARMMNGVVESFQQRKTMLAKSIEREVLQVYADPKNKGQRQRFEEAANTELGKDMGSMHG